MKHENVCVCVCVCVNVLSKYALCSAKYFLEIPRGINFEKKYLNERLISCYLDCLI